MRRIEVTTVFFNKKNESVKGSDDTALKIEKFRKRRKLYELTNSLKAGVFFVVILFVFLVRGVAVEGISMQPTLNNGDFVLVSSLFYEVERGDIIVIAPYNNLKTPIIKRVIGVEGDVIDIDFKEHKVFVNSKELDEPYIGALTAKTYDIKFPVTVPEDSYFVLGDNRNDSLDSRSSEVGFVKSQTVFGEVLFRMMRG